MGRTNIPYMELPCNRFHTASTFEVVLAMESEVRPSPFSPNNFGVFPGCIRSLGRDHQ
ncbi:hypothetical protein F2Q69_00058908 [Brassica cretica]|uniref:Uncharacterized protein n=1 Tax=Brassica cretica TaxID=69181 RepID=A0A8S9RQY8_BRACR|nr:hypothetical protein F2Q69_00058908 [Brassica cretica]